MKRKKKIFRPKRRYRIKRRNSSMIKAISGIAALALLVFVGYSAAGPVSRFLEQRAAEKNSVEETDNAFLPAPDETDLSAGDITEAGEGDDVENTISAKVTASDTVTAVYEETTVSETELMTEESEPLRETGAAHMIPAEAMSDKDLLSAALEDIRAEGCSAVIFPMKTEGGIYNYKTAVPLALTVIDGEDPFRSELTAGEIAQAAVSRGLRPVALISVLTDNNRYGDYRDGAYRSMDDSTWLDTSPEKGGKPWISPFDDTAREFLCDTVRELGEAGFTEIIAEDFIFPEFRSSDIELIGDYAAPYGDRGHALASLAVMMTQAGEETGSRVMLRITANSVIKGYSELFIPEDLSGCHIAVDYSENNISPTMIADGEEIIIEDMSEKDRVSAVYREVNRLCGEENIDTVPMLERDSMTADEFAEAVFAVSDMGYDKYYVY